MKALLLAAGVGRRLGGANGDEPKALLRFGDQSLLERHVAALASCGVSDLTIVVGHRASSIRAELARLSPTHRVQTIDNPRYREGSMVSLACAAGLISDGDEILLMDADVLYDRRLLDRLLSAPHANCFLLDRDIEPGDEPVKLCIRGGVIVDFSKRPTARHDWHGESVGFFRFAPAEAAALARRAEAYAAGGGSALEYEAAIRDLVLAVPGRFGYADITGLPWVEIDFAEDIVRANREIMPRLVEAPDDAAGRAR